MPRETDDLPLDPPELEAWQPEQASPGFEERVMASWRAERRQDAGAAGPRASVESVPSTRPKFLSWPVLVPTMVAAAATVALFARPANQQRPSSTDERAEAAADQVAGDEARRLPRTAPVVPLATLVSLEGTAYVLEPGRKVPAHVGQVLSVGQGVLTVGPASSATVAYPDGSAFDLGPEGFVTLMARGQAHGKLVFLPSGVLRARVTPQLNGLPFGFTTPHGEVTVLGTKLSLHVSAAGTDVRVTEGHVRLTGARGILREVQAGQRALLAQNTAMGASSLGGTALFLVGSTTLGAGDQQVRRRLESLGLTVKVRGMGALVSADVKFNSLIVLSSTGSSEDVLDQFRDVAVPLVTWEESLFDDLAMTGPPFGKTSDGGLGMLRFDAPAELVIKDAWHPLAAGLSSMVRVTTAAQELGWGRPSPFAYWVATFPNHPTQAAVFGYEEGAMMVGMTAPARRVGLFFDDDTPSVLTDAGWAIFDSAVRWAVGDRAHP